LVSADAQALSGLFRELIDKGLRDLSIRGMCSSCSNTPNASTNSG
jgi:hypothetical protein